MTLVQDTIATIFSSWIAVVSAYLPKLLAGALILIIGLIVASLVRDLVKIVFKYFKLESLLESAGVTRSQEFAVWPNLVAEVVRWFTIFIFLMSAVEVWGIPKVADVLNQFLQFLPNVLVAVIIGWIGIVASRFSFDIVRHGVKGVGDREAGMLGNLAKYAIVFFTALVILTQLGVAADLVKILFTGIVAMLALSFGLAFGLGGKDEARKVIEVLHKKTEEKRSKKSN